MEPRANEGLLDTVGATPLVRLNGVSSHIQPELGGEVWAKLESFNPGGSAKDRTARMMVSEAEKAGLIHPGAVVVESSSGNLGVALAREATLGGWEFHCVVDVRTNHSTLAYIQALGAHIHQVKDPDPKTGDWLVARRNYVEEFVKEHGAINLDQYSNPAALRAHSEGTMCEIVSQLGFAPDFLVVAVSTTGTVGGCATYLRNNGLATQVVAVDAQGSVLYGGQRAERILPGYGAGITTQLSEQVTPDRVIRVSASDAVAAARRVARATGFLPGASGGAVCAAVDSIAFENPAARIVAIFHDDGSAYLDTVYNDEWVQRNVK